MPITFPGRKNMGAIPLAGLDQLLARMPAGGSTDMRTALTVLGSAYRAVHDNTARYQRDATVTPAARTVRSARFARRTLGPAIEGLKKARVTAAAGRSHLQEQMDKVFAYSAFPEVMIAAEIRSHFAALKPGERMASLNQAAEAGDVVTLKAIGTGPCYLAGLTPDQHKMLVRDKMIDLNPDARLCREAAEAFDQQAEFATLLETTVMQATAELIDFVEADSFEAAAQDAVAA